MRSTRPGCGRGRGLVAALLLAAGILAGTAFHAQATITWGSATTVSGASDVSTSGTLGGAFALRSTQHNTNAWTVNGVTFQSVQLATGVDWGTSVAAEGPGGVTMTFTGNNRSTVVWVNETGSPYNTMNSSYLELLKNGFYLQKDDAKGSIVFSGLTVGATYTVQFWVNKLYDTGSDTRLISGANEVVLDPRVNNDDNTGGQFVTGTFTASAASETVEIGAPSGVQNGNAYNVGINAVQIRLQPVEPPTVAIAAPTPSQSFISGASITATATVGNAVGSTTVTFYTNNSANASDPYGIAGSDDDGAPYTNNLGVLPVGNYHVYAVVSADNGTVTSQTNAFSVALPALAVTLTAPTHNAAFPFDVGMIAATATVANATGTATVRFYTNSTLSGSYAEAGSGDTSDPYAVQFGAPAPGTNYIYATVVDDNAATKYSVATNAFVVLAAPSVSLTAPADNGDFFVGTAMAASATVAGGAPAYTVTFYTNHAGDAYAQAGSPDSSSPYGVSLTGLAVGDDYHIYAKVSDGYSDEGTSSTRTFRVLPVPSEILVAADSAAPAEPYATWGTAAHDIKTAVDYAASFGIGTVTVSNGTYNITAEIVVSNGITVRSFNNGVYGGLSNASRTIVAGNGAEGSRPRVFNITHSGAVVDGFTIRDGNGIGTDDSGHGGNVRMIGGVLQNCIVTNGATGNQRAGGGVYMNGGGTVSNCVIVGNNAPQNGAGIYANAGYILSCVVKGNWFSHAGGGAGIRAAGEGSVVIRNCLICNNYVSVGDGDGGPGAGVYMESTVKARLENCTIVSNHIDKGTFAGGGVYKAGGESTLTNCIVYFNSSSDSVNSNYYASAGIDYSCTAPLPGFGTGNTASDPKFVDAAAGDFRLLAGSPCIDTGMNQAWMTGAKDLAGNNRIQKSTSWTVDMGAYETYVPPSGTVFTFR